MATELHLDPELAEVVERSRTRAVESGEWPRGTLRHFESKVPPEAAEAISAWLRDGGYDEAIEQITTQDPDLANQ
jgi:hypothetical protein